MFYSQTLVKEHKDNFCVKCETRFDKWTDYHSHVVSNKCYKAMKPVRTTNRSHAQIVLDWETQNERNLIQ